MIIIVGTITIITSTPIPKAWNLYPLIKVHHGVGRVAVGLTAE
jgi:hypothetical protein